jgi:hypothetical protein
MMRAKPMDCNAAGALPLIAELRISASRAVDPRETTILCAALRLPPEEFET